MSLNRIARHLVANRARVRRAFPAATLKRIEDTIAASERLHSGQVRVVIEGALDGHRLLRQQSVRERALEVFAQQHVWDTEANNGVLIYLLLADRRVEIVADRGIHGRVGDQGWQAVCAEMEQAFSRGDFEAGALIGIGGVTALLAAHFPRGAAQTNELPDAPVVM